MEYGNFVFKCNCGSVTPFSPVGMRQSSPHYNALEAGLRKAGLGWTHETGYGEYMCPDCLTAVDEAIDVAEANKKKTAIDIVLERGAP